PAGPAGTDGAAPPRHPGGPGPRSAPGAGPRGAAWAPWTVRSPPPPRRAAAHSTARRPATAPASSGTSPVLSSTSLSLTPDFCPKPVGAPAKRCRPRSNVQCEKTITRKERSMLSRLFAPKVKVSAHCDLPCGVYDPAQARIEAESVKAVQEKMAGNDDPHFQARATVIKEQRAELAKHHVSVLWSDYFKPPHFEKYPELHQLVNDTLKALSAAKASTDPATGQKALDYIAQIDKIFWETKKARSHPRSCPHRFPVGPSWVSGFTKGSVRSCAAGPLRAVRGRTRGAAGTRGVSGILRCCGPVRPGRIGVGFGGRGGVGGGRGDVVRAPGVLAGALHPGGDPRAERLATSDDQLDRLSAGGTRVLFAAHALRVGLGAAQRSLLY